MIQTICLEEQLSGLCSSTTLARAYFSFLVTVWFARLRFLLHVFLFFFFFNPQYLTLSNVNSVYMYLFMVPYITFFSNFFIKNGFHNTIYTFKNYFTTVFLISVFNFNKNKLNPNTSLVFLF